MSGIMRLGGNAPWEADFGYVRAVKAGDWLLVAGTTSFADGMIVGEGRMYEQARQAIANIATALERAGYSLADVVRTRMFVTDMSRADEVARAHREAFGAHPPAATLVEVRRLVEPEMLIEIEADAFKLPAESDEFHANRHVAPARRPRGRQPGVSMAGRTKAQGNPPVGLNPPNLFPDGKRRRTKEAKANRRDRAK